MTRDLQPERRHQLHSPQRVAVEGRGEGEGEEIDKMQSQIELAKSFIAEGEKFTFENFSHLDKGVFGTSAGKDTPAWFAWKNRSLNLIGRIEHNGSAYQLASEGFRYNTVGNGEDAFRNVQVKILTALRMTIDVLEAGDLKDARLTGQRVEKSKTEPALDSKRIFVVHGHDQSLKTDVERFLHQLGLEPVVLHRKPDKGQTIIEKFEENSDVGYAFILLTPDEFAYTVDQEKLADSARKKELRARPNVIFEFGFFVGKLGRRRVCCIYKEGVVLPSDLTGLIYKKVSDSIDSQAYSIIQELKAAGYEIQI